MERFTDDFLQFFTKKRQKLAFGQAAGYSPSNPSTLGIFFRFPNFLRSYVLSRFATPLATVTFTFWGSTSSVFLAVKTNCAKK